MTAGKLTGQHVLFMLLGFFGIMIAVNTVFTVYAVRTFPGEEVPKSYMQGLKFNDVLEDRARQKALNWTVAAGLVNEAQVFEAEYNNANGDGLTELDVTAYFTRPASETGRHEASLEPSEPGRYFTEISALTPGVWTVELVAVTPTGERHTARKTIAVK